MATAPKNQERDELAAPHKRGAIARALVVEDSMIIAMDTEDTLRNLGVSDVVIASSVAAALEEIDGRELDFALLDFNLGDESSDSIAEDLFRRGTPFWFVTGYGDAIEKLASSRARGVLKKPFSAEDIEEVVEEVRRL